MTRRLRKQLQPIFEKHTADQIVLIGMGNIDRADDGAGLMIAEALKREHPRSVLSEKDRSVESHVMRLMKNGSVQAVIFIDTAHFMESPGSVRLFTMTSVNQIVPAFSTHQISLSLLMETLVQEGKSVCFVGIQPGTTEMMEEMSREMLSAVEHLIELFHDLFALQKKRKHQEENP